MKFAVGTKAGALTGFIVGIVYFSLSIVTGNIILTNIGIQFVLLLLVGSILLGIIVAGALFGPSLKSLPGSTVIKKAIVLGLIFCILPIAQYVVFSYVGGSVSITSMLLGIISIIIYFVLLGFLWEYFSKNE